MPYLSIADFKYGLDRRRPRHAGVPGTLWDLRNAHITRGGDIERPKKFVPRFSLPAGTFGFGQIRGQLWVFGSADLSASMPVGVQYQRLQSPLLGAVMLDVLDVDVFDNKFYVIASYNDGHIYHFYDGVRITDLDPLADANSSFATLADLLATRVTADPAVSAVAVGSIVYCTAAAPGVPFALTGLVSFGGVPDESITITPIQASVPAVAEVRGTGTVTVVSGTQALGNRVTQITVNGVPLLAVSVDWTLSNDQTASLLAIEINNSTSTSGYSAAAVGNVVTLIAAPGAGSSVNGHTILAFADGNVVLNSSGTISGGVTEVAPVAQVTAAVLAGTYETTDIFTLTVDSVRSYSVTGRASGYGTNALVYKKRLYQTAGSLWRWCQIDTPTNWTPSGGNTASGAGFINIANDSEGSERLVAAAKYQQFVAIFARRAVHLYTLETDATLNTFSQSIENTGALAPKSVIGYGNTDVFYLDETGIRSLRARDVTNTAYVDDVGSAIDTFVQEYRQTQSEDAVERAVAAIEPVDSRLWLAIGSRIFVLSHFPRNKISAWSYYEPGFTPSAFAVVNNQIYARDATTIYLYGGISGQEYPSAAEQIVQVRMPFMSAQTPATFKEWEAFDIACTGVWDVKILVDPTDETKVVNGGKVFKTTNQLPAQRLVGRAPLFAVDLTCDAAGPATISSFIAHFVNEEAS